MVHHEVPRKDTHKWLERKRKRRDCKSNSSFVTSVDQMVFSVGHQFVEWCSIVVCPNREYYVS